MTKTEQSFIDGFIKAANALTDAMKLAPELEAALGKSVVNIGEHVPTPATSAVPDWADMAKGAPVFGGAAAATPSKLQALLAGIKNKGAQTAGFIGHKASNVKNNLGPVAKTVLGAGALGGAGLAVTSPLRSHVEAGVTPPADQNSEIVSKILAHLKDNQLAYGLGGAGLLGGAALYHYNNKRHNQDEPTPAPAVS